MWGRLACNSVAKSKRPQTCSPLLVTLELVSKCVIEVITTRINPL